LLPSAPPVSSEDGGGSAASISNWASGLKG